MGERSRQNAHVSGLPWRTFAVAGLLLMAGGCASTSIKGPQSSTPSIWPTDPPYRIISSGFGQRRGGMHRGVDISAKKKEPVRATAPGRVIFSGRQKGFGRVIRIDHGGGVQTLYAHLSKRKAKGGDRVARGDVIGRVGKSGNAKGSHVHYEVHVSGRAVNPRDYLP